MSTRVFYCYPGNDVVEEYSSDCKWVYPGNYFIWKDTEPNFIASIFDYPENIYNTLEEQKLVEMLVQTRNRPKTLCQKVRRFLHL